MSHHGCLTKVCTNCNEEKTLEEFHKQNTTRAKHGVRSDCKACVSKKGKKWARNNPEKLKERQRQQALKRKYGVSRKTYYSMLKEQGGVCAGCGVSPESLGKELSVDHCHSTGNVRGLLCSSCNFAIGLLKDSPITLGNLTKYLTKE